MDKSVTRPESVQLGRDVPLQADLDRLHALLLEVHSSYKSIKERPSGTLCSANERDYLLAAAGGFKALAAGFQDMAEQMYFPMKVLQ